MTPSSFAALATAAFAADAAILPSMTLRAGDALDRQRQAPPFDAFLDAVTDAYLERHAWGIGHLDAASWRHYLPAFIAYAARFADQPSEVVDALLTSLRPPDRHPPRLGSLTLEQEAAITQCLDALAFGPHSAHAELAGQVLEEWGVPGALLGSGRA